MLSSFCCASCCFRAVFLLQNVAHVILSLPSMGLTDPAAIENETAAPFSIFHILSFIIPPGSISEINKPSVVCPPSGLSLISLRFHLDLFIFLSFRWPFIWNIPVSLSSHQNHSCVCRLTRTVLGSVPCCLCFLARSSHQNSARLNLPVRIHLARVPSSEWY